MQVEPNRTGAYPSLSRVNVARWGGLALVCGGLLISACVLPGLDPGGKACPCPLELQCDPVSRTCVSAALDLSVVIDGGVDSAEPLVAGLASLEPSAGTLSPPFDPAVLAYQLWLPIGHDAITVKATPRYSAASLLLDGVALPSAGSSAPIDIRGGPHVFAVSVVVPGLDPMAYEVTVVRSVPLPLLPMATTTSLGAKIAASGDTVAVSALPSRFRGSTVPDQVHVFRRDARGTWTEEQAITAPATCITFGNALALSVPGAAPTLAVSCALANNLRSVKVYTRAGTTWTEQATLTSSNLTANDGFGRALALSGDTLFAGASGESSNAKGIGGDQTNTLAPGAGAAYAFGRDPGTQAWSQQAYIKASNTDAGDNFGASVALDGNTLVVGATSESSASTGVNGDQTSNTMVRSGAAYVFVRSGATWAQQAYLKASNPDVGDYFGTTLACEGDRVAIGATGEASAFGGVASDPSDNSAAGSGAVYIFSRSTTTWAQEAYVKAPRAKAGAAFGSALAMRGKQLLVGAPADDSAAFDVNGDPEGTALTNRGAAHLFRLDVSETWQPLAFLKSNDAVNISFGTAVALGDDWLVVGAPSTLNSTRDGALYRFGIDP